MDEKFWFNWFQKQPEFVHYKLQFAVYIENVEKGWCEMLVNIPTMGVFMCYILN